MSHGSTRTHLPVSWRSLPPGLSASGLVDTEDPDRNRLGQQRLGVRDERPVRRRPRHLVGGGDLGDGAGRLADRGPDLGAQPPVVRARAGICSIASVNDPRVQ